MDTLLPILEQPRAEEAAHIHYKVGVRRKTRQVNIGGVKVGEGRRFPFRR